MIPVAKFKSLDFWLLSLASAFALMAQVGFIVHQMPIVREIAAAQNPSAAVVLTTVMALVGRLLLSMVADLWSPRRMFFISILLQASALSVMSVAEEQFTVWLACALFGLSIGNTITLPVLIIQREYSAMNVVVPLGLATAVVNVISAFGPGALGCLRDLLGGYRSALLGCIAVECLAAFLILKKSGMSFVRARQGKRSGGVMHRRKRDDE
jgi:predicted MFS family arabinose efflux permease